MKPKKKDIQKWVKALRSGEYNQTVGKLQDYSGFCCLGVACKIFIPEEKQITDDKLILQGGLPEIGQFNAPKWLHKINDDFRDRTGKYLAAVNDEDKLSFNEIAEVLEAVYIHKVLEK